MRIDVRKTPKLFIDGAFVRSESCRTFRHESSGGSVNIALASRKDVRDAVRAARRAQPGWSGKTAYNRGQVLYRLAEMLEARRAEFHVTPKEFAASVDLVIWLAGWCDKIEQYLSTKNPVAGPHFNVSSPEPTGVVGAIAPKSSPLLGLVCAAIPPLCGGNAVVIVASSKHPLQAVAFAEAVAVSDLPAGALNVLTGNIEAVAVQLASHMDVDAVALWSGDESLAARVREAGAENVKRIHVHPEPDPRRLSGADARTPWSIAEFMEIKTVWHPAGM